MDVSVLLLLIPALPLAASIICATLGPRVLGRYCHIPVILCLVAAFVCSFLLFLEVPRTAVPTESDRTVVYERVVPVWQWAVIRDALPQALRSDGGPVSRDLSIEISLRADAMTAMMLTMVTFISSLIAIYSSGYMHGDRGYWRFFAYLSLFVFSMTMLVSASNFLLLYVFWEAVGVCSYLLIGFWYEKPEAAAAGKKAFLVNRIGDFGFALGLFLLWTTYGTLNFHDTPVNTPGSVPVASVGADEAQPSDGDAPSATGTVRGVLSPTRIKNHDFAGGRVGLAICLLLMIGACGKSAQFPLHVWLPDAMEGPTPVSALIHAATMVTAGVYMIARCTPLLMVSPESQIVVACIGGGTALLAALIAITQYDLKRVLAYSTVSQLGYMFLGLGAGTFLGITSGMFHLFTHAFFKALLFLGAGSVMHAMGNVIDMRRFGGLRLRLPVTHATFLIGCCALAGLPPFAGFWSKDAVVASIEEKVHSLEHGEISAGGEGPAHADAGAGRSAAPSTGSANGLMANAAAIYGILFYVAMVTAFLTALYTFRAYFLTFHGPERIPEEAGHHAHESPAAMCWPLIILSIGAAVAGFALDLTYTRQPIQLFAEFLSTTPSLALGSVVGTRVPYAFHTGIAGISAAVAVAGTLLATYLYLGDSREVQWLKSTFDLENFSRWYESRQRTNWGAKPWVAAIHRGASRIGLGWLATLIGQSLLLAGFALASPLLLGNFFSPYKLSFHKFFLDELYGYIVVVPLRLAAAACYAADRWIVDGLVNACGKAALAFGSLMRSLQMGLVQFYALAMFLGVLVLIATKLMMLAG